MKKIFRQFKVAALAIILCSTFGFAIPTHADGYGINMSPLNQKMVLNAGESHQGSFTITNPSYHDADFKYEIVVKPFYVDENYNLYYDEAEGVNQIVDWITVDKSSGLLPINQSEIINFKVQVPEDAPAGGQYAAIVVSSKENPEDNQNKENLGVDVNQTISMAQIIYAEIAGTTKRQGEILSADMPSFLLSGNITGSSAIKNTGNVHGIARYVLQVFPLFSNEEIYTNEENPEEKVILPNRVLHHETTWNDTPAIGIFNAIYTVEFEGVTTQVSKMIIKCPIWLLFIIIFVIMAIIIYFIAKARKRGAARAKKETA